MSIVLFLLGMMFGLVQNSIVLKGVKMSNGSVLGANSLLNRDTEEYEICAGNPAKKINFRN